MCQEVCAINMRWCHWTRVCHVHWQGPNLYLSLDVHTIIELQAGLGTLLVQPGSALEYCVLDVIVAVLPVPPNMLLGASGCRHCELS